MERKKIEQATRVTDKAITSTGNAVVFSYETCPSKKTTACAFSIFKGAESAEVEMSGQLKIEENYANIYFNQSPSAGSLTALAEVIIEIEKIFELEKVQEDATSASE